MLCSCLKLFLCNFNDLIAIKHLGGRGKNFISIVSDLELLMPKSDTGKLMVYSHCVTV